MGMYACVLLFLFPWFEGVFWKGMYDWRREATRGSDTVLGVSVSGRCGVFSRAFNGINGVCMN